MMKSAWINGFVAGVSWRDGNLRAVEYPGLDEWMRQYCAAHPSTTLQEATKALVQDLKISPQK